MSDSSKVAVVTGAAAGIGRASASAFANAGYRLALVDRDDAGSQETVEAVPGATAHLCDLSDPVQVASAFGEIGAAHGRIDALHANAGVSTYFSFDEVTIDEIQRQVEINLLSHLYCVKEALPLLAIPETQRRRLHGIGAGASRPSRVRAVRSGEGRFDGGRAHPRRGARRSWIRVNSVSPGTIDTPMLHRDLAGMDREQAEGFLRRSSRRMPSAESAMPVRLRTSSCFSAPSRPPT